MPNSYWMWLIVALICLIIEISTGPLVFAFFAGSAVIVALATSLGLDQFSHQFFLFGLVGILSLIFFRKKLIQALKYQNMNEEKVGDQDQTLILEQDIAPGQEARVSYQGSLFTAINLDQHLLKANTRVRILRTDGIKLHLVSAEYSLKK